MCNTFFCNSFRWEARGDINTNLSVTLGTNNDEAQGFIPTAKNALDSLYADHSRASTEQKSVFMFPKGCFGSNQLFNDKRTDRASNTELQFDIAIVASAFDEGGTLPGLLKGAYYRDQPEPEIPLSDGGVQSYAEDDGIRWLSVAEYAAGHFEDLARTQDRAVFACVQVMIQGTQKSFNEKKSDEGVDDKLATALASVAIGRRSSRSPRRRT